MKEENPHLKDLAKIVSTMPQKPGVYRWLDEAGTVLYVGKAKKLRDRLKSYVSKPNKNIGPWKLSLIKNIAGLETTITQSELEALVLETNLIKEMKPKYNVLMKDDKNYVYVQITIADVCPTIDITRQMDNKKAKYFGPFLTAQRVRYTLDLLQDILGYRSCKESIRALNTQRQIPKLKTHKPQFTTYNLQPTTSTPCLQFQIGQCNGLCTGKISPEEYGKRMHAVIDFFKGNHTEAKRLAKVMMKEAANNKKFERAARLRDALAAIEKMKETQMASDTSGQHADYLAVVIAAGKAQAVVLQERGGKLIGEQSIALKGQPDSIVEALEQFIPQYYTAMPDIPNTVVISEEIEDHEVMQEWLQSIRGKHVDLWVPERGKKSKLLELAIANAEEKLRQQAAAWEAAARNLEEALEQVRDAIGLPDVPKRIEGYDISHLGGTETVGSMVVMINGKPNNKDYRSFTIQTLKEGDIDDYKALKEVLRRRLRHLSDEVGQWKEKGVLIGKARKGEDKQIEEIIAQHKEELGQNTFSYKDFTLARKEKEIIGFGRMTTHKDKTIELQSIWVHQDYRGQKLGKFISRSILKKIKKGKVYILINQKLEEYYASLGFRHVHTPPDILKKELVSDTHPSSCNMVMLYNIADNKEDTSLKSKPDLLVIDGGKGQLSSVVEVLKELELDIPVIGLAKKYEEVFVPGNPVSILLPNNSQGSFLLQRLRDEAHRFANAHREKRLSKRTIGSALDDVPGIGPKTRKELLTTFRTVENIKDASDDELLKLITQTQLKAIRES
ncbi:MAG: excinuclease ABC subunit UvrC [bacterium]|nr:excinuclease ABC subunit UvrC [bacterium]